MIFTFLVFSMIQSTTALPAEDLKSYKIVCLPQYDKFFANGNAEGGFVSENDPNILSVDMAKAITSGYISASAGVGGENLDQKTYVAKDFGPTAYDLHGKPTGATPDGFPGKISVILIAKKTLDNSIYGLMLLLDYLTKDKDGNDQVVCSQLADLGLPTPFIGETGKELGSERVFMASQRGVSEKSDEPNFGVTCYLKKK
jgi:hypothetical protein